MTLPDFMPYFAVFLTGLMGGLFGGCAVCWLSDGRHRTGGYAPTSPPPGPPGRMPQQPPYRSVPDELYEERRAAGMGPVAASLLEESTPPGPDTPAVDLETVEDVHRFYSGRYRALHAEFKRALEAAVEGDGCDTAVVHFDMPKLEVNGPHIETFTVGFTAQDLKPAAPFTTLIVSR